MGSEVEYIKHPYGNPCCSHFAWHFSCWIAFIILILGGLIGMLTTLPSGACIKIQKNSTFEDLRPLFFDSKSIPNALPRIYDHCISKSGNGKILDAITVRVVNECGEDPDCQPYKDVSLKEQIDLYIEVFEDQFKLLDDV